MIRSQLCAISGITVPTFNSHRRNGDLPFDISQYEASDGGGRVWARFDLFAAARILAAKDLTGQGVTWSVAARILREPNMGTGGRVAIYNPGIFIGRAVFAPIREKVQLNFNKPEMILQGPLSEIVISAHRYAEAASRIHPDEAIRLASLVAVDMSSAYQRARDAALERGIDTVPDYLPDNGED